MRILQCNWIRLSSVCVVAALLAAGCGDDGSKTMSKEPEPRHDAGDASTRADASTRFDASTSPSPMAARDGGLPSSDAGAPVGERPSGKTLRVDGRDILDTCGEPWQARGLEQLAGKQFSADGTLTGLASELAKTSSNAVRLLPQIAELSARDLDGMLAAFAAQKIIVYLSPGERSWFKRKEIREVLLRHEGGLILDAFQEPTYDDVPRWVKEAKAAIADLRSAGYTAPLTVLGNQYGRDLRSLLDHGAELVAADTLHNTIIGWQAYWGTSGWYQKDHGLSLSEGVQKCAEQSFPIQLGIDLYADKGEQMDYAEVMDAAESEGLGWLWWNFWNQWDDLGNNASKDGTAKNLTEVGEKVIHSDPNSIEKTAKKACFR